MAVWCIVLKVIGKFRMSVKISTGVWLNFFFLFRNCLTIKNYPSWVIYLKSLNLPFCAFRDVNRKNCSNDFLASHVAESDDIRILSVIVNQYFIRLVLQETTMVVKSMSIPFFFFFFQFKLWQNCRNILIIHDGKWENFRYFY